MKSAATLALLALFAASPALAQFTDVNAIISSIGKNAFLRDANAVDGASSARVERLSTFLGAKTAAARLAQAEAVYGRDIDFLHSRLVISPIVMQAIRASSFDVNAIVAVSVDSEGSAILYADDL